MDLNTLTNFVLLICLVIFIVVLAYRALSGFAARPRYPRAQPATVRYIGRAAGTEPQVLEEQVAEKEALAPEEPPMSVEATIPQEPTLVQRPVAAQHAPGPRRATVFPSILATELLSRAADEDAEEIQRIAKELVDYCVVRGSAANVRPEVLEKLAVQFATLEVAVRKASIGADGEARPVPDDLRSDLFREAFRLLASQAKR